MVQNDYGMSVMCNKNTRWYTHTTDTKLSSLLIYNISSGVGDWCGLQCIWKKNDQS